MSNERETILQELWRRIDGVSGVVRVVRNPEGPSDLNDHPAVHIIELGDLVTDRGARGGRPIYKRKLTLAVEVFVAGTSEGAASQELLTLVSDIKSAIFSDGVSMGENCEVAELDSSRIEVIPGGDHIRGIGIGYQIAYIEQV